MESLGTVSTVFTTAHVLGLEPCLFFFYPMLDFLIHLSLFAKSFYFCTNDLRRAGIFLAKILKSRVSLKGEKKVPLQTFQDLEC